MHADPTFHSWWLLIVFRKGAVKFRWKILRLLSCLSSHFQFLSSLSLHSARVAHDEAFFGMLYPTSILSTF